MTLIESKSNWDLRLGDYHLIKQGFYPTGAKILSNAFDIVAPRADTLMESLRATGYSLPDAVSDLIDNSIYAGARNIWLNFHWDGAASWVTILDDGSGMSESNLRSAMRVGSQSPIESRAPSDLGRFGLGLKTASISQARSLTVATSCGDGGGVSVRRWDLDHLVATGDWQLLRLSPDHPGIHGLGELQKLNQGTLVVWEKLDRLVGDVDVDDEPARGEFLGSLRILEKHLAMVFHRYMVQRNRIAIWLNGRQVERWDPFLTDNDATQNLGTETLGDPGDSITVTSYVLPHHSRLSTEAHRDAGGPLGWNAHQGFYVYRNRRLLVAGDWLGLGFQKEEHYKLARIQVDLPNSFDHEWDIDVRKSRASPPLPLQVHLRRIARVTRNRAVEVYRHRGKAISRSIRGNPTFVWNKRVTSGKVHYEINRDHPLVRDALGSESIEPPQLRRLLRLIEEYVPVQQIWVDMAEGDESQMQPFESAPDMEIQEMTRCLYRVLTSSGLTHGQAVERLGAAEIIGNRFEVLEAVLEGLAEESRIE